MDNITPTFSQGVQSSGSRLLDGLRGLPYYDYSIKQPQSIAPSYGIPTQDLTSQIQEAAQAGHSISDVHSAIDDHPQITDKTGAKSFAQKIYDGLENFAANSGPIQTAAHIQAQGFVGGIKQTAERFANASTAPTPQEIQNKQYKNVGGAPVSASKLQGAAIGSVAPESGDQMFQGFKDITTKILDQLKGKTSVSKQFISDLTNQGGIRQAERDVVRKSLDTFGENVPVSEFANKVKTELLPLERKSATPTLDGKALSGGLYENVTLPPELRGPVANYSEHIYQSPIKTKAGDVHFGMTQTSEHGTNSVGTKNYFAHTRVEDLPALDKIEPTKTKGGLDIYKPKAGDEWPRGDTRRIIELQSDLFQKGRLDGEMPRISKQANGKWGAFDGVSSNPVGPQFTTEAEANAFATKDIAKLEPYQNTWHERVIREEVKQAAKDGKSVLQFPTGETAMKIEGLVNRNDKWVTLDNKIVDGTNIKDGDLITYQTHEGTPHPDRRFLITNNNGNGTFDAVDSFTAENDSGFHELIKKKGLLDDGRMPTLDELHSMGSLDKQVIDYLSKISEHLSSMNTVDTNNPIYKFYEKEVGKFLSNQYGAKQITDSQGVKWWQMNVPKEAKNLPVQSYGRIGTKTAIGVGVGAATIATIGPLIEHFLTDWTQQASQAPKGTPVSQEDHVKSLFDGQIPFEQAVQVINEAGNDLIPDKESALKQLDALYHPKKK